jgi:hypothetical protein
LREDQHMEKVYLVCFGDEISAAYTRALARRSA